MSGPISFPSSLRPPITPNSRLLDRLHNSPENASPGIGKIDGSKLSFGRANSTDATPSMIDLLADKAGDVNKMQHNADSMVHEMLTGGDVNSAEVLTAVQKADMAFRTLLQVRNKLIEAYREVLQIQV